MKSQRNMWQPAVESALLMRGKSGRVTLLWYPSVPAVTVNEWLREIPPVSVSVYHMPSEEWSDGAVGHEEICYPLFRHIAALCTWPGNMEEELWSALWGMKEMAPEDTAVVFWGQYFAQLVKATSEVPEGVSDHPEPLARPAPWWQRRMTKVKRRRAPYTKGDE